MAEDNATPEPAEIVQVEITPNLSPSSRGTGDRAVPGDLVEVIKVLAQKASPDALKDVLEFVRSTDDKESQRKYELEGKKETTKRLGMASVAIALIAVLVHAGITKNNDLAEKLLIGTVAGISGVIYGKSQRDKD